MVHTKLLLSAVICILVSYRLYIVVNRPIPPDIKEPIKVKILDEIGRIANVWIDLAVYYDFNPAPEFLKSIVNFVFKLMLEGVNKYNYNVEVYDDFISGVPVKVFKPEIKPKPTGVPTIIYLHGGGWTWFSVDTYSGYLQNLSNRTKCIIVAVEYSLAPKYPFPRAYEDVVSVTWKILMGKSGYPIDTKKVILAGDGAGGNLAAAVSRKFQGRVLMQLLINPSLQFLDFKTPSHRDNADVLPGLTSAKFQAVHWLLYSGVNHQFAPYLTNNEHILPSIKTSKYFSLIDSKKHLPVHLKVTNRTSISTPYFNNTVGKALKNIITNDTLSPAMLDNVQGIPNAYVITSQYDVVRDEGIMYTNRLHESGTRVKLKYYRDSFHGFFLFSGNGPLQFEVSKSALDELTAFIHVKIHGGY